MLHDASGQGVGVAGVGMGMGIGYPQFSVPQYDFMQRQHSMMQAEASRMQASRTMQGGAMDRFGNGHFGSSDSLHMVGRGAGPGFVSDPARAMSVQSASSKETALSKEHLLEVEASRR